MTKSFLITAIAISVFILLSCTQSSKNQNTSTEKPTVIDSTFSDGHNSSNSLDVDGEYIGTLPCADCEGIKTTIKLNTDKSYVKQTSYLGKDGKVFEDKGFYSWNSEGNTITLIGVTNAPNQYFVGENMLIQLDMEGNRITGNLSDKYVLRKKA